MKSVLAGTGIGRKTFEEILRENGHQPRTLRQSVGLRYTRMTRHEIQSLVAKAHIAKRGRPASHNTQERRAKTFEATLQLASRADLILAFWLAQRSVKLTPQKAVGPYNIDIAIDELAVAVEVNGSWHYFAGSVDTGVKRRAYLLDRGWSLIEVRLTSTSARPWKYLRPACADKIVSLLDELRGGKASWGKNCVIGGDGEFLPGEALDYDNRAAILRPVS
jgi:very-short-patch-repair endonuclease